MRSRVGVDETRGRRDEDLLDLHGEDGPEDVIPELGGHSVPEIKVYVKRSEMESACRPTFSGQAGGLTLIMMGQVVLFHIGQVPLRDAHVV